MSGNPRRFSGYRNRNSLKKDKVSKSSRNLLDYVNTFSTLIIGIVAVSVSFYTCNLQKQGNKVSEAAYNLSRNDSSQQKQINQLREILLSVRDQNVIEEGQRGELLKITRHGNNQDSLSNQILGRMERQVGLSNQQLEFSSKEDSISAHEKVTGDRANIFALRATFDELGFDNLNLLNNIIGVSKHTHEQRLSTVSFIKEKLDKQLTNPIVLNDKILRAIWFTYYRYVKVIALNFAIYARNGNVYITEQDFKKDSDGLRDYHITFINSMLSRLNYLENKFYEVIQKDAK
ncbi:MAG TPA: hypothetical protein VF609_09590 [Flavisolibacter sp.]|jgi:hypothetical protein